MFKIGRDSLDSPLLKYAVKDHLFKACLVYMCYDLLEAQIALKRYYDMSSSFNDSREYNLINEIINSVEENSIDQFEKAVI
ncbi:hypothetical protein MXB_2325 [Myxobolus squamalis]|nr:hypothetical protein MXB_2325 [Myxobolus squamalis]